jgi:hypothetical protein
LEVIEHLVVVGPIYWQDLQKAKEAPGGPTQDDLRSRLVERQGCDAYQWALLISTHVQRHILQIRQIKADPKFPGK